MDKVNQLFSKIPHYNKVSRQYELDFRDRGRAGLRIQRSVKNFQLTMEVCTLNTHPVTTFSLQQPKFIQTNEP